VVIGVALLANCNNSANHGDILTLDLEELRRLNQHFRNDACNRVSNLAYLHAFLFVPRRPHNGAQTPPWKRNPRLKRTPPAVVAGKVVVFVVVTRRLTSHVARLTSLVARLSSFVSRLSSLVSRLSSFVSQLSSLVSRLSSLPLFRTRPAIRAVRWRSRRALAVVTGCRARRRRSGRHLRRCRGRRG
jgi:hypothetical protein